MLTIDTPAFQFKGGMFTLMVLHLTDPYAPGFSAQLRETVRQAPRFFENAPVVIDLSALADPEGSIDFMGLERRLREHKLIPVGVRGGTGQHHEDAMIAGMAVLPPGKPREVGFPATTREEKPAAAAGASEPPPPAEPADPPTKPATRIVTSPVRSGTQIYVPGGDLIVLASVGSGAEVLADGNIHVYGPLRGRALAGVAGDRAARIFCRCLEAELVSVAGRYRVSDDLAPWVVKQSAQIYLDKGTLRVDAL